MYSNAAYCQTYLFDAHLLRAENPVWKARSPTSNKAHHRHGVFPTVSLLTNISGVLFYSPLMFSWLKCAPLSELTRGGGDGME